MIFNEEDLWRGRMITSLLIEEILKDPLIIRKGYTAAQARLNTSVEDTSHSTLDSDQLMDVATIGKYDVVDPLSVIASSVRSLERGEPIDPGAVGAALAINYLYSEKLSSR